jgi:riboflavin biosynthesis pyrimidine reductase
LIARQHAGTFELARDLEEAHLRPQGANDLRYFGGVGLCAGANGVERRDRVQSAVSLVDAGEMRLDASIGKMKKEPGPEMAILGSGSVVSQLAQEGLVDEYQIVVNPVVLGNGKTAFDGIKQNLTLKLTKTRTFGNGNVFLCYEPTA